MNNPLFTPAVKAKNVVTLKVDGISAHPGLGTVGVSETNTKDPLYLGGVPGNVCVQVLQLNGAITL